MDAERVGHGGSRRGELSEHGVVAIGEPCGDADAAASELGKLGGVRGDGGRPSGGVAVDLVGDGELCRVAGHEGGERDGGGAEPEGGGEGEVVDHDGVGGDPVDDVDGGASDGLGFPQEVGAALVGLVAQRRHHAEPGGGEERSQVVVGRPVAGDAGVAAAAHPQLAPVEPGC